MVDLLIWGNVAALVVCVLCIAHLGYKATLLSRERELQGLSRASVGTLDPLTVIIPVRNEARNIVPCLDALARVDYPELEIIVADDRSTDGTAELVERWRAEHPACNVRVVHPPEQEREGWALGKSFVLWHASREARHGWLLFIDADTQQRPDSLWRAVSFCEKRGLEAFTMSGTYPNPSLWGDLLEFLTLIVASLVLPLRQINDPASPRGWMNGQFILFRRAAYERIGGHTVVREHGMDDMALGSTLKRERVRYAFLPGAAMFECRNYVSLGEAFRGWTRNLAGGTLWLGLGHGFFFLSVMAILVAGVLPFVSLPLAFGLGESSTRLMGGSLQAWSLASAGVGLSIAVGARAMLRTGIWRGLLLPISAVLTVAVLASSYRARYWVKRVSFRGSSLSVAPSASEAGTALTKAPDGQRREGGS